MPSVVVLLQIPTQFIALSSVSAVFQCRNNFRCSAAGDAERREEMKARSGSKVVPVPHAERELHRVPMYFVIGLPYSFSASADVLGEFNCDSDRNAPVVAREFLRATDSHRAEARKCVVVKVVARGTNRTGFKLVD